MKCKVCNGKGAVLFHLGDFKMGDAFRAFMSAGCLWQQDERGTTRHEIVCPQCDGKGTTDEDAK